MLSFVLLDISLVLLLFPFLLLLGCSGNLLGHCRALSTRQFLQDLLLFLNPFHEFSPLCGLAAFFHYEFDNLIEFLLDQLTRSQNARIVDVETIDLGGIRSKRFEELLNGSNLAFDMDFVRFVYEVDMEAILATITFLNLVVELFGIIESHFRCFLHLHRRGSKTKVESSCFKLALVRISFGLLHGRVLILILVLDYFWLFLFRAQDAFSFFPEFLALIFIMRGSVGSANDFAFRAELSNAQGK